jgi:hypothetical protein
MDLVERLNAMLARPREPYRILRPDVPLTVHHVSWWLRRHHEGGWLAGEYENPERDAVSRRLLWTVWRMFARHPDVLTEERAAIARLDSVAAERREGVER